MARVIVDVMPKPEILDPQGKAVQHALSSLGFEGVNDVRQGKFTLLDDDERVTPRTRDAVAAAVASGTRFVLATGRPPRWVAPVVDALGFAPPAVCANGAVKIPADARRSAERFTSPCLLCTSLAISRLDIVTTPFAVN